MIKWQQEFTEIEAMAICEMLAILSNDDYCVNIYHGESVETGDGDLWYQCCVEVTEKNDDSVTASGKAPRLLDALTDAYQSTPERTNGPTMPMNATDQP